MSEWTHETWQLCVDDLEALFDQCKSVVLDSLHNEGELSDTCYEDYSLHRTFMLKKPNKFFGTLKRLFSKKLPQDQMKTVRIFLVKLPDDKFIYEDDDKTNGGNQMKFGFADDEDES